MAQVKLYDLVDLKSFFIKEIEKVATEFKFDEQFPGVDVHVGDAYPFTMLIDNPEANVFPAISVSEGEAAEEHLSLGYGERETTLKKEDIDDMEARENFALISPKSDRDTVRTAIQAFAAAQNGADLPILEASESRNVTITIDIWSEQNSDIKDKLYNILRAKIFGLRKIMKLAGIQNMHLTGNKDADYNTDFAGRHFYGGQIVLTTHTQLYEWFIETDITLIDKVIVDMQKPQI